MAHFRPAAGRGKTKQLVGASPPALFRFSDLPRGLFQHGLVNCQCFFWGVGEVEGAGDAGGGGGTHGGSEGWVFGEAKDGFAEGGGVAGRNDEAGDAVFDDFGKAADVADDGGDALGHGFEGGLGEAFALDGGHYGDVAGTGDGGGVLAEAEEVHVGLLADAAGDGGVADFADEDEVDVGFRRDAGEGVEKVGHALDGAHVAGEADGDRAGGEGEEVEGAGRRRRVPRWVVAFPDDGEAGFGDAEAGEVASDGVGDADDGGDAGVEIGKPGGGVEARDVAHGAAVGNDFRRIFQGPSGKKGVGEGVVGERVDDVERAGLGEDSAVEPDAGGLDAGGKTEFAAGDGERFGKVDGGRSGIGDGVEVDAGGMERGQRVVFDTIDREA